MSPDDVPALAGLVAAAVWLHGSRVRRIYSLRTLWPDDPSAFGLIATLVACYLALWFALIFWADREVREDFGYQAMFVAAGAIAMEVVSRAVALLGLDAETDVIERRNVGAGFAIGGLWLATTLCAMASNLGQGDEISTTLVPLLLCAAGLVASASALALGTRCFAAVTSERSSWAAVRLGAYFILCALPLSHAARGDWVSLEATLQDFAAATPQLGITLAIAIGVERGLGHWRRNAPARRDGA